MKSTLALSLIGWVVVAILSALTYSILAAYVLDFGGEFEDIDGVITVTIFILIAQLVYLLLLIFVFLRKLDKLLKFNLSILQIAFIFTLLSLVVNVITRYLSYAPSKGVFLLIGLNAAYAFIVFLFITRKHNPNNSSQSIKPL